MVNPLLANGRASSLSFRLTRLVMGAMTLVFAASVAYAAPPQIRTDADNAVPRCVTPKRLMAFLKTRNSALDSRFADIASLYKRHGEAWNVRWDYAFFQMAVETNFLTYKKSDGGWGDVNPKQNNFAGLGTTGGGVPGDSYPDVNTGVLAQIQHLVVYSGEHIDAPVGARTKLKQDDILESMASKKGRVTFADLARRWAADRHYGASIEWVANSYRQAFCRGPDPVEEAEAAPAKKIKHAAVVEPLAPAANLGGPAPDATETDTKTAPVRTIWSRADGATEPESLSGDVAEPAPTAATLATRKVRLAPMPARKPVTETAAVAEPPIVEQIIQTGEASPPNGDVAAAAPQAAPEAVTADAMPASEPAPAAEAAPASEPRAFAYAAAMDSTLPEPSPTPKVATSAGHCRVLTASYGGKKILLVRSKASAEMRFTVLTVLEGFERSMLDNYLKAHAPGGSSVGEFESKDAAFAKAKELCPSAAAPHGEGASAG
jgi:Mannosyl-glycoprotein endo-beta-N-acetylglucosaminidase